MKIEFSDIFKKFSNVKFRESRSSDSQLFLAGGRTRDEVSSRFWQPCERV
jgi:hypothetical protein